MPSPIDPQALLGELGWLQKLARSLALDGHEADDLVQETLLGALRAAKRPQGDLRAWLTQVLRHRRAIARRTDGRRHRRELQGARPEATASVEEVLQRAELQRQLVAAVFALREPYHTAIVLRYFEGLEPQEIARRLGIRATTARTRVKRGLDALRRALDREHGGRKMWLLAFLPFILGWPPRGVLAADARIPASTARAVTPVARALGSRLLVGLLALILGAGSVASLSFAVRGAGPVIEPAARTQDASNPARQPGSETAMISDRTAAPRLPLPIDLDAADRDLDLGPVERKVHGAVELRVTDGEGFPGERVSLKVQIRTEVPLNHLYYRVTWTTSNLRCAGVFPRVTISDPETGEPLLPYDQYNWCTPEIWGQHAQQEMELALAGSRINGKNHPDRPFEYFRPLGEWIDIADLELDILEAAGGGTEIPLRLSLAKGDFLSAVAWYGHEPPQFYPHGMNWPCSSPDADRPPILNWTYDGLQLHDGVVRVLGDKPEDPDPQPGLEAGVRWVIEDVEGAAGELVDVPIWASAQMTPLTNLVSIVETDPPEASIESVAFAAIHTRTHETVTLDVPRGETGKVFECADFLHPETCAYSIPGEVWFRTFHEMRDRFAMLQISPSNRAIIALDYPGKELRQLGVLRVRVPADLVSDRVVIRHTALPPSDTNYDLPLTSGALVYVGPGNGYFRFSPAGETRDGTIFLRGAPRFIRSDANGDGAVDLSDAVHTLSRLFLGGANPLCLDAADVDDGGSVSITDPIALLGSLFQGRPPPPPPYPACGGDPTDDALDCGVSSCR